MSHEHDSRTAGQTPRHAVLVDPQLTGFQYGTQRDLEDEIVRVTGGALHVTPNRRIPAPLKRRIAHGTRYDFLRKYLPRERYDALRADVLWVVLMGPESFTLDLFKGWDRHVGMKILYLFDTFESQLEPLRKVLASTHWDVTVTSFHGAVPFLERETQRKWFVVPQGVTSDRFAASRADGRPIAFSAYGRRDRAVHQSVLGWCTRHGRYYDFSIASAPQRDIDAQDLYSAYAWHLTRSAFTFCWPVEMTHPTRAKTFSPITCRWFEAAAAGTVMVGQPPRDRAFVEIFGDDAVVKLDVTTGNRPTPSGLAALWDDLWIDRDAHLRRADERRAARLGDWTWERRVREMMSIAGLEPPAPHVGSLPAARVEERDPKSTLGEALKAD